MSNVAVNEVTNRIENEVAEEFLAWFKERPKAVFIDTEEDGILLIDLPREVLDELVGVPVNCCELVLCKAHDSSMYVLAYGYSEPEYMLVYSARL